MLESPFAIVRRLPRTIQVLVLGTFVNRVCTFIVPYLAVVLRRSLHVPATQVAWLMAAYGAGSVVSILGGGFFTDLLGRRRTLLLSLGGSGTLAVAMAFAPSFRALVPLLVAFGFLADLYRPAASAIIGDLLPSDQRATGFAALRVAINLGFAIGMSVGGFVADWSWRVLFAADGFTTLLFALVVLLAIPETRPLAAPGGFAAAPREAPWRDRVFLQVSVAGFLFSVTFFSHVTVLPLSITVTAGYPSWVYGLVVGINGLLIVLFEVSLVARLHTLRRLRLAAAGLLCVGLGYGATGLAQHWAWYLLTVVVWTAGEILSMPLMAAFVADWAPPAARGRYLSLYQATWSLGFIVNPILCLRLHEAWGERFWPLLLVVTVPAALIVWRLDHAADRPELLRGYRPASVPA